jgi:predicted metal-binding membrane protein
MTAGLSTLRGRASEPNAEHTILAVCSLLFVTSATLTIVWCARMSAMDGMPMAGGWTMSMAWMRTADQTWAGAAVSLLAMWVVMMVAMMTPSLLPTLWRYREAVAGAAEARLGALTALVGVAYFCVWALLGIVVLPLGLALAAAEMRYAALSRAVPIASGLVGLLAGACQFTTWKADHLACCRESLDRTLPSDASTACRYGIRLGLHCCCSSAGLTAILLVMGVMDLRVMAAVTTAVTAERLAPAGGRVAQAIGATVVGVGALLIAQAAGLD